MSKTLKQTFYKTIVIPQTLEEDVLKLNFTKIKTDHAFHLIDVLITKAREDSKGSMPYDLVVCAQAFLKKLINQRYFEVTNPLLENTILERTDYFNPFKGIAFKYRVNPKYFKEKNFKLVKRKVKYKQVIDTNMYDTYFNNHFIDFASQLKIPLDKLYNAIDEYVETISADDFIIDESIRQKTIYLRKINEKPFYAKIKTAIEKAHEDGMHIIQDDKKFYHDTLENFIARKKRNVKLYYNKAVANLEDGNLKAGRNRTNFRLDHNFTSLPSVLLKIIMKENNLVEIDAVNSQVALLANMMRYKGVKDVKFYKHAVTGKMYDVLHKKLKLDSRNEAKILTFMILFGNYKTDFEEKQQLQRLYPKMMNFVYKQKEMLGSKKFPVKLQRVESKLYVDQLLIRSLEMGYPLITKHDSIICKEEDLVDIGEEVLGLMEEMNFQCQLKVTKPDGTSFKVSRHSIRSSKQIKSCESIYE